MIVIVFGFSFSFGLQIEMCALLSLCCSLSFVVADPSAGKCVCCGPPTHLAKQTGQAINGFDILHLFSMGAQPGPQPQDLRHHRASAAPHFSHTIYLHTTLSARSSTYTIRRLSSSTAASATQLKPAWSRITGHAEVSVSPPK